MLLNIRVSQWESLRAWGTLLAIFLGLTFGKRAKVGGVCCVTFGKTAKVGGARGSSGGRSSAGMAASIPARAVWSPGRR